MSTSSVIRQKTESQNGGNKKTKNVKFSEKRTFLNPTCACQGVKNVCFFGKFDVLCFPVTSVLRFAFLPYCRQHTRLKNIVGTCSLPNLEHRQLIVEKWKLFFKYFFSTYWFVYVQDTSCVQEVLYIIYFNIFLLFKPSQFCL